MKSKDLRKVVMQVIDDGMSLVQIAKHLRNVVSQRTIRRWKNLYKERDEMDLKNSTDRSRIVRTKGLMQTVGWRVIAYNGQRNAK